EFDRVLDGKFLRFVLLPLRVFFLVQALQTFGPAAMPEPGRYASFVVLCLVEEIEGLLCIAGTQLEVGFQKRELRAVGRGVRQLPSVLDRFAGGLRRNEALHERLVEQLLKQRWATAVPALRVDIEQLMIPSAHRGLKVRKARLGENDSERPVELRLGGLNVF